MVRRSGAWPLPWKRIDEDHDDPEWCEVVDANGDTIPFIGDLQYEVDQDQISAVDALIAVVNSYPALLAAARAVVENWEKPTPIEPLIDALRAAVEVGDD